MKVSRLASQLVLKIWKTMHAIGELTNKNIKQIKITPKIHSILKYKKQC